MATTTHLITVEQYSRLPDPPGGRLELHHGEVILMSWPPKYHADLEDIICDALKRRCGTDLYRIRVEFACRPLPEYEVWAVDIGLVSKERWKAARDRDWLAGSPELAIEILSPSNTKREMQDRQETLFRGGCKQFWTVDFDARSVTVTTPDGQSQTYTGNDSIPLEPYASEALPLAEIFSEID
jgi:Uma2 family endonuclease